MSIFKIQIKAGKPVTFDPNPLTVYGNDSVFWYNNDSQPHWPAPSVANKTGFLEYQIAPDTPSNQVSFPDVKAVQTIPYVCVNHPNETGQIIVKPGKKAAFAGKTKKGAFGAAMIKGAVEAVGKLKK